MLLVSWARFDDRYHDNRKIKRAWRKNRGSVGLHSMAVTYCAMHETDGVVDGEWLEDKLPAKRERDVIVGVLVEVGLFSPRDDGAFEVNDYLEYNHSKQQADAQRAAKATRQAKWRERNRSSSSDTSQDASIDASTDVSTGRHGDDAPTRPDPTRPFPFPLNPPPSGGRKRSHEVWDKTAVAWAKSIGVDGPDPSLLRAVTQAQPWKVDDPIGHFHRFVGQWFNDALDIREEAA